MVESWFRGFWKTNRKHVNSSESSIGVLAFEVASLMAKLIHLWTSLSDNHVAKLRQDITNSLGIKKLVSDDDDFIVSLICAEMFENLGHVVRAVARLAEKCSDPSVKNFQHVFDDMVKTGSDPYGWCFTNRKMDNKAKKMGRFISVNASLYQEMEALSELEHTLRRLKANEETDGVTVVAYEKKAAWKRHEVKQLKEVSLWNKTYDYTVLLLARSLSTIYTRIGHVFGLGHMIDTETRDARMSDSDNMYRSQSISTLMQSSVHPAENGLLRFASGPMGNLATRSGPIQLQRTQISNNFHSGPLGSSNSTMDTNSRTKRTVNSYSGPLEKSTAKSPPSHRSNKTSLKFWQSRKFSSTIQGKSSHSKSNQLAVSGPLKGCMMAGNSSPVKNCLVVSNGTHSEALDVANNISNSHGSLSITGFKQRFLNPPPESLGAAALALHYANVIIVIEKLAATPHLIGHDAKDDLYNMLPESVRLHLRAKLSPFAKSLTSSDLDSGLAQEWSDAMSEILEWLAPLAHNMIRWQSERSFEHQNQVSRTNVLLVQTLHFADRHKTEELITELLVGLNYVWRYTREVNAKALLECASGRALGDNWDSDGKNIFALDHHR